MHERIISNLSSPWTGNNVKLLARGSERFVRKAFGGKTGYLREIRAYRALSEKFRPKLLRNLPPSLTIKISYDPVVPNTIISGFDIGTLMSQPHASTKGMSPCVWTPAQNSSHQRGWNTFVRNPDNGLTLLKGPWIAK